MAVSAIFSMDLKNKKKRIERNNWTCVFLKKGISVYKKQKQQQKNKLC